MTDPITDPDLVEHLDDATLVRAYEEAQRSPRDAGAVALAAEIERRGLVV